MNTAIEVKDGKAYLGKELDQDVSLEILNSLPIPPTINFKHNEKITSLGLRLLNQILKKFDGKVFYEECTDSILVAMNISPCFIPSDPMESLRSISVPWLDENGISSVKNLLPKDCIKIIDGGKTIYSGNPADLDWLRGSLHFLNSPAGENGNDLSMNLKSLFHDIQANLRHSEDLIKTIGPQTEVLFKRLMRRTRTMIEEVERKSDQKDGEVTLHSDSLEICLLVQEFQAIFKENGKTLHFDGLPQIPIKCDTLQIERVTSCLLYNALKASRSTTNLACHVINVVDLKILVQDDGDGIPPEQIDTIFKIGLSIGKEGGTGIGLYSSKNAIEELGGSLRYSRSGGLSLFEIYIPSLIDNDNQLPKQIVVVSKQPILIDYYKTLLETISGNFIVTYLEPGQFHEDYMFHLLISNDHRSLKIAHKKGKPNLFANLSGPREYFENAVKELR